MKIEVGWSLDERKLYVSDRDADEHLIEIHFLENWRKEKKRELLKELLKALERGEECQHSWISDEMTMRHCLRCGKQEAIQPTVTGAGEGR